MSPEFIEETSFDVAQDIRQMTPLMLSPSKHVS